MVFCIIYKISGVMKKAIGKGVGPLKLQALEYFITLAESRSINEAARRLYIAQPSLTKALQHLEKKLGVQLFHREKSGITLTQAGEKILPEARQVVQYYKGWLALGKAAQAGAITVYSHLSLSNFLLPDVLLGFKKKHPEVTVNHHAVLKPEEYLKGLPSPLLVLFICSQEEAQAWGERYDGGYFTLFQESMAVWSTGAVPWPERPVWVWKSWQISISSVRSWGAMRKTTHLLLFWSICFGGFRPSGSFRRSQWMQ